MNGKAMHKPRLPVQQLCILVLCRLAEPVVLTSILPYLPELIEFVGVPKLKVGKWVGIANAAAAIGQASMAVPWGWMADYVGRKPIIITCLTCSMIASIMLGMSHTLSMVLATRILTGLVSGNIGIIRTMVAEIVPERELQPRAFSLMPLVWTIGSIFGPSFGGALARPAEKYPGLFGKSVFLRMYPFALPNLLAARFFVVGIAAAVLFLKETLASKKDQRDYGIEIGKALTRPCTSRRKRDINEESPDEERTSLLPRARKTRNTSSPSWSQILTPQSRLVLVAYAMTSGLGVAFDSTFPVFLHHPKQDFNDPDVKLPFKFTSGFGVDSQTIGLYYSIVAVFGMLFQFLCFPPLAKRYGVLNCYKAASLILPAIYVITPFTVLVPEPFRIPAVLLLLLAKLGGTTFGIPCCTILLTNSASSMSILGTLNGIGTSVSAVARGLFPALIGAAFSRGVENGSVVLAWWLLALFAAVGIIPGYYIVEQDGPLREEVEYDEAEEPGSNGYGAADVSRATRT